MAFEKRKFVVESGCCAAAKRKIVHDRVLELAGSGLDHGEIVGVAVCREMVPMRDPRHLKCIFPSARP